MPCSSTYGPGSCPFIFVALWLEVGMHLLSSCPDIPQREGAARVGGEVGGWCLRCLSEVPTYGPRLKYCTVNEKWENSPNLCSGAGDGTQPGCLLSLCYKHQRILLSPSCRACLLILKQFINPNPKRTDQKWVGAEVCLISV